MIWSATGHVHRVRADDDGHTTDHGNRTHRRHVVPLRQPLRGAGLPSHTVAVSDERPAVLEESGNRGSVA